MPREPEHRADPEKSDERYRKHLADARRRQRVRKRAERVAARPTASGNQPQENDVR